jgi:hypothetical protein
VATAHLVLFGCLDILNTTAKCMALSELDSAISQESVRFRTCAPVLAQVRRRPVFLAPMIIPEHSVVGGCAQEPDGPLYQFQETERASAVTALYAGSTVLFDADDPSNALRVLPTR